jgi:hypothetical protein
MKTNALLIAMVLLGAAALAGPAAGLEGSKTNQALSGGERIIVNTVVVPHEYSLVQTQAVISVPGPKGRTDVAVELIAYRHALPRGHGPPACYEFQIRSKETNVFIWSCWLPDFPRPHRFQVWTTESGKSYACFVQDGVHLYELRKDRQPEERRRAFWVHSAPGAHPDALPILPIDQIQQAFAPESRREFHLNPTTYFVEVLELTDRDGELRVTVRGHEPRPKDYPGGRVPEGAYEKWLKARATFALRGDHWELVSTTGK